MSGIDLSKFLPLFISESQDHLANFEEGLIQLSGDDYDSETINAIFRAAHSIKGSGGMYQLDRLVHFAHVSETVLDFIRQDQLAVSDDLIELLFDVKDFLSALVAAVESGEEPEEGAESNTLASLEKYIKQVEEGGNAPSDNDDIETTSDSETSSAEQTDTKAVLFITLDSDGFQSGLRLEPVLYEIKETIGFETLEIDFKPPSSLVNFDPTVSYSSIKLRLNRTPTDDELEEIFGFSAGASYNLETSETQDSATNSPISEGGESSDNSSKDKKSQQTAAPSPKAAAKTPATATAKAAPKLIKVQAEKLDSLVTEVGELLLKKSQLDYHLSKLNDTTVNNLLDEFEKSLAAIRESSLALRLVPLNEGLMRSHRTVREAAKATGKDIKLTITGGDTELDRITVDKLGDPLTHILRNSCDHGIETPEVREASGKDTQGSISLDANYQSGNVVLTIKDDGKGIPRDIVLNKAIDKGLVSADENPSDRDIYNLIFHPGFSTAEAVTDLSGRGVGMDVVRRNINDLGGTVIVDSAAGKGTTLTITLPLTSAIMDGFLIESANQPLIVAMDKVLQCVPKDQLQINQSNGNDCMLYQGEYIPTILVSEQLGIAESDNDENEFDIKPEDKKATTQQEAIVVMTQYGKVALIIDHLEGELQGVIKPMGPILSQCQLFGGMLTLPSGDLAFLLDINTLAKNAQDSLHNYEKVNS